MQFETETYLPSTLGHSNPLLNVLALSCVVNLEILTNILPVGNSKSGFDQALTLPFKSSKLGPVKFSFYVFDSLTGSTKDEQEDVISHIN